MHGRTSRSRSLFGRNISPIPCAKTAVLPGWPDHLSRSVTTPTSHTIKRSSSTRSRRSRVRTHSVVAAIQLCLAAFWRFAQHWSCAVESASFMTPFLATCDHTVLANPPLYQLVHSLRRQPAPGENNEPVSTCGRVQCGICRRLRCRPDPGSDSGIDPIFSARHHSACDHCPEKRTHRRNIRDGASNCSRLLARTHRSSIGYFGHHGIHELVQNPDANAYGFGSLPANCAPARPSRPAPIRDSAGLRSSHECSVQLQRHGHFFRASIQSLERKACFRPTIRTAMPR